MQPWPEIQHYHPEWNSKPMLTAGRVGSPAGVRGGGVHGYLAIHRDWTLDTGQWRTDGRQPSSRPRQLSGGCPALSGAVRLALLTSRHTVAVLTQWLSGGCPAVVRHCPAGTADQPSHSGSADTVAVRRCPATVRLALLTSRHTVAVLTQWLSGGCPALSGWHC